MWYVFRVVPLQLPWFNCHNLFKFRVVAIFFAPLGRAELASELSCVRCDLLARPGEFPGDFRGWRHVVIC